MPDFDNDVRKILERLQKIYNQNPDYLKDNQIEIRIKYISSNNKISKITEVIYSKNSKEQDSQISELPSLKETPELKDTSEEIREIVKIYLEETTDSESQKKPWFEPKNLLYPILGGLIVTYHHEIFYFFNWIFHYLKNFL